MAEKRKSVQFFVSAPSIFGDIFDRVTSALEYKLYLYSESPLAPRERRTTLNLRDRQKQHADKYSHRHVSFEKNVLDISRQCSSHFTGHTVDRNASHHHPSVSHRELFFDLIFVVVCIEVNILM